MLVVASANGLVGIVESMYVLKQGGSAIDAVEVGVRMVEANVDDHTVGRGGFPNFLGEVELDAGIMDGGDLMSGAVGGMKGYKHAISVARQVMEKLPHVFLVGDGAARFASEMGFEYEDLLTGAAKSVWQGRLLTDMSEDEIKGLMERIDIWQCVSQATDPERAGGTVNFLARDKAQNIAAGVSTSGWAWKYPGRLGDSPVVGAGLYADNRYGAAACTGMGEMAIRACTAHSIVFYLKMGLSLNEAGNRAMNDLNDLGGNFLSRMNFVTLDREENHAGFSNDKGRTYIYMTADMSEPEELPRIYVPTKTHWNHR